VSFLSNLTLTTTFNYFGNCFLKNDTSSPIDNLGEMNAVLKLFNYTPGLWEAVGVGGGLEILRMNLLRTPVCTYVATT